MNSEYKAGEPAVKPLSRNQVFKLIGTKPTNERWSWCAIAPNHSIAAFTLWEDEVLGDSYVLLRHHSKYSFKHGYNDQKTILEAVLENNIPSFGLVCIARDTRATTRSIKEVRSENLIRLRIQTVGDEIRATLLDKVHPLEVARMAKGNIDNTGDGINDIAEVPPGVRIPDRAAALSFAVVRDSKVREYVIKQAGGLCEYCGERGFATSSGTHFLEAHHIITLAKDGKDILPIEFFTTGPFTSYIGTGSS